MRFFYRRACTNKCDKLNPNSHNSLNQNQIDNHYFVQLKDNYATLNSGTKFEWISVPKHRHNAKFVNLITNRICYLLNKTDTKYKRN